MEKIAIISDIHGDFSGLQAVIRISKLRYAIYNPTENSIEFRAVEGELLPLGYL